MEVQILDFLNILSYGGPNPGLKYFQKYGGPNLGFLKDFQKYEVKIMDFHKSKICPKLWFLKWYIYSYKKFLKKAEL